MDFTKGFKKINKKNPYGYSKDEFSKIDTSDDEDEDEDEDDEFELSENEYNFNTETEHETESETETETESETETERSTIKLKLSKKNNHPQNKKSTVVLQEETDFVEENEIFFFSVNNIKH